MTESRMLTVSVTQILPTAGPGEPAPPPPTPSTLIRANREPLRVVVRNISAGGAIINVAYDVTGIQNAPVGSNQFELPAGTSEVFVLMPGQSLYAASPSVGARAALAASPAIPIDLRS